jgi:zinc protease
MPSEPVPAGVPALDRTRPPVPGPPAPLVVPPVESFTLSNGFRVLVATTARLPVVSLSLVFLSGASADGPGEEGLAQFSTHLLEEGTTRRSSSEIAEAIESLGARMSAWSGWDASGVSVSSLARQVPDVLPLLSEVVLSPAFPENEVERLREERLAEILQDRSEPGSFAAETYLGFVAPGHRYGVPQGGSDVTVRSLRRDAILAAHACFHRPGNTRLAIVGDVRIEEIRRRVEELFGGWEVDSVTGIDPVPPPEGGGSHLHCVDRPGAVQSEVRLGHVSVPRNTPDYFPLVVMNTALGGCFNSRLMLNLREAHGYTYGATSRFDFRRIGGIFTAGAAVRSEVTAPAIKEFRTEIERMAEVGVTMAELQYARDYLAGVYPLSFETTSDVANQILLREIYDLPEDYAETYQARVQAVTSEDVLRVARTHLHPDRLTILVLGDRSTLRDDLERLEVPMSEYDEEARPFDGRPAAAGSARSVNVHGGTSRRA